MVDRASAVGDEYLEIIGRRSLNPKRLQVIDPLSKTNPTDFVALENAPAESPFA